MLTPAVANAALPRNARRIFEHIVACSGATGLGVIRQVVGLSIETARKHVNALCAADLVEVRCTGARVPAGVAARDVCIVTTTSVAWTQDVVPTLEWQREGETARKPGPNSYCLCLTVAGRGLRN